MWTWVTLSYFAEDWQFLRHIATICSCPQSRFWLRIYAPSVHWQVLLKVKSLHGMQLDSIVWVRCLLLPMFSGPPKTVLIPLLWKDLQACILTNRCRGYAEVMLSLFLAEVMLHAEADQNDSGGEMDSGHDFLTHQNNCMSLHGDAFCFVGAYFLLFGFPFHGIWRVRLHMCRLTPRAHCVLPLWEGIYTCFWDRCRVRGREGTAFPFPMVKHLIYQALVHLLAGKRRPWWKQWEEWGRFLTSIGTWMWVAIVGILHAVLLRGQSVPCVAATARRTALARQLILAVVPFLCCALYANLTECVSK